MKAETQSSKLKYLIKGLALTMSSIALISCGGGSGGGNSGGNSGGGGGSANVPPSFTGPTEFTFAENDAVNFSLTVTDPDSSTVTVTDDTTGDGSFFSVDANGNVSATTAGSAFDFENPQDVDGNNIYEQNITLSDGVTSTTTTIRVTIANVNERPTCTTEQFFDFKENVSGKIGSVVGTSSDPENDTITAYTLTNVRYTGGSVGPAEVIAQEQFILDAVTGDVSLTNGLDAEGLRNEAPYVVSFMTEYGSQSVDCFINFTLIDVPGVVTSGVKFTSELIEQQRIEAVGDVDNDGLTDFVISRTTTREILPRGRMVFGSAINNVLAIDGAEELDLNAVSSSIQSIDIIGNYPEKIDDVSVAYFLQFTALGDIDGDNLQEIAVALRPVNSTGIGIGVGALNDNFPFAYVLWGDAINANTDGIIDLATATPSEALQIFAPIGNNSHDFVNVSSGDMDGNGLNDLLIGGPRAEIKAPNLGFAFVLFGETLNAAKSSGRIDLGTVTSAEGVHFFDEFDFFDRDLSSAGDIDGDGAEELLAGYGNGVKIITSQEISNAKTGMSTSSERVTLFTDESTQVSLTQGDSDGDGFNDVLMSYRGGEEFAALVFARGINTGAQDKTVVLSKDSPTNDTIIFGTTERIATFAKADFIGDLDGDNKDEIALLYVPASINNQLPEGALYIIKGSALENVSGNFFDVAKMTTDQGLKILDSSERDMGLNVVILEDSDNDGFADIGLSAAQGGSRSYIIPSSDIITALTNGDTSLDIQANFNDESGD